MFATIVPVRILISDKKKWYEIKVLDVKGFIEVYIEKFQWFDQYSILGYMIINNSINPDSYNQVCQFGRILILTFKLLEGAIKSVSRSWCLIFRGETADTSCYKTKYHPIYDKFSVRTSTKLVICSKINPKFYGVLDTDSLPVHVIRWLSKCVMIWFGYHTDLGDVKCSDL